MLDVASKMQSLRHGFAKRTTARIALLLILRFKCRIADHSDLNTARISSNLICFFPCFPIYSHDSDQTSVGTFPEALDCPRLSLHAR